MGAGLSPRFRIRLLQEVLNRQRFQLCWNGPGGFRVFIFLAVFVDANAIGVDGQVGRREIGPAAGVVVGDAIAFDAVAW